MVVLITEAYTNFKIYFNTKLVGNCGFLHINDIAFNNYIYIYKISDIYKRNRN